MFLSQEKTLFAIVLVFLICFTYPAQSTFPPRHHYQVVVVRMPMELLSSASGLDSSMITMFPGGAQMSGNKPWLPYQQSPSYENIYRQDTSRTYPAPIEAPIGHHMKGYQNQRDLKSIGQQSPYGRPVVRDTVPGGGYYEGQQRKLGKFQNKEMGSYSMDISVGRDKSGFRTGFGTSGFNRFSQPLSEGQFKDADGGFKPSLNAIDVGYTRGYTNRDREEFNNGLGFGGTRYGGTPFRREYNYSG